MVVLARLDVISPTANAGLDQVLASAKAWLAEHNLQPTHLHSAGRHQLMWACHGLTELWPEQDPSVPALSLLVEYAAHQIASLCPIPVQISAGLLQPGTFPPDVIGIDLPYLDQREICEAPQPGDRLLASYQSSELAKFHRHYYAEKPRGPELWETTYDRIDAAHLPACVAVFLQKNYAPLQSWRGLQHFTRGLLGLGWHPRHIAGLVWSRWARDWADQFADPRAQADHSVRCCSGLIGQQLDLLGNFSCEDARATGFCPPNPCCPVDLPTVRHHLRDGSWQP